MLFLSSFVENIGKKTLYQGYCQGETGNDFFESLPEEFSKTFFESIISDSAGYLYINPDKFRESFAQDVDPTEANIWATV
jgi:hypothetical protein